MNYKKILNKEIKNITKSFTNNELAYLALTSKIELPFRDRLAFTIHKKYPTLIVSREWKRSDLVLLQNYEPSVILELKAMYTFDAIKNPKKFKDQMLADIEKSKLISNKNTEILSIILATHPCSPIPLKYKNIIKYLGGINGAFKNFESEKIIKKEAKAKFESLFDKNKLEYGEIKGGVAFDINVDILYWIL